MQTQGSIRLVCEVRAIGDSLTGRVTSDGDRIHEFTGWLGLLGLLQELVLGTGAPPNARDDPPLGAQSTPASEATPEFESTPDSEPVSAIPPPAAQPNEEYLT